MCVRKVKYADFGITKEQAAHYLSLFRSKEFDQQSLLLEVCKEVNAGLSEFLLMNLVEGMSFERVCAAKWAPCAKTDFYCYRKLVIIKWKQKTKGA